MTFQLDVELHKIEKFVIWRVTLFVHFYLTQRIRLPRSTPRSAELLGHLGRTISHMHPNASKSQTQTAAQTYWQNLPVSNWTEVVEDRSPARSNAATVKESIALLRIRLSEEWCCVLRSPSELGKRDRRWVRLDTGTGAGAACSIEISVRASVKSAWTSRQMRVLPTLEIVWSRDPISNHVTGNRGKRFNLQHRAKDTPCVVLEQLESSYHHFCLKLWQVALRVM